jgi:tetratricopeptide (TPR) repeat protein
MLVICGLVGVMAGPAAFGQLAPLHHGPASPADRATTASAVALIRGDYPQALAAADQAVQIAPNDPWAHYDRASALRAMQRTDEAVSEMRKAQLLFGDRDPWGRSLAMFGEANAFAVAGRCPEAQRAFTSYATYVQNVDPASAEMARRYSTECVTPR